MNERMTEAEERAMIENQMMQEAKVAELNRNMAIQDEQNRAMGLGIRGQDFSRSTGLGGISPEMMMYQQEMANRAAAENTRAGQGLGPMDGTGPGGNGNRSQSQRSRANEISDAVLNDMAQDAMAKRNKFGFGQ